MEQVRIGIIGGSGLYQMPELTDVEEIAVETPFGSPSDALESTGCISSPARPWTSRHTHRVAVSRQHLRHEVAGRRVPVVGIGRRVFAGKVCAA